MKMQLEAKAEEAMLRITTGPTIGRPGAWKEVWPHKEVKLGGLTPLETYAQKGCLWTAPGEPKEWEL
jgi:hypothetical protein